MPLSQVLDKLRDDGQLFWRRDPDFVPEKDKRTVRLFLSSPSGFAWEVLVTGLKWFDVRAGKGGGGGIDLVMHLLGIDFVKAVKLLSSGAGVLSRNRRNFRHPSSSPATSASRSIILPSLWKV
ncbi:MAG TPA: hypothetical protein PK958_16920 [Rhodocyclaceae bacterium]|nr:hypothetical protein [Rhodocyclaceae bacterium]